MSGFSIFVLWIIIIVVVSKINAKKKQALERELAERKVEANFEDVVDLNDDFEEFDDTEFDVDDSSIPPYASEPVFKSILDAATSIKLDISQEYSQQIKEKTLLKQKDKRKESLHLRKPQQAEIGDIIADTDISNKTSYTLKSNEELRKAIVWSEILKKKY
ncbi:hypothetical protein [Bacteroides sp.]|uniref:hypothetical protein n=1 Tax=Bacteroides sp. TaxID=29523 RepID=UPI00258D1560|nr:hypothetical protein [Bacteroides sp.]